jgi:aryl-alcohol dehydrogenase-like predicted oxidoreductase
MDLMQVHNLVDWQTHLDTQALEGARQGSLHWRDPLHGERLRPARPRAETEDLDFVQLNYSIVERDAERRLLPLPPISASRSW